MMDIKQVQRLTDEIERFRGVIEDIRDEAQSRMDVVDGDDGRPKPDAWMSLYNLCNWALREEG